MCHNPSSCVGQAVGVLGARRTGLRSAGAREDELVQRGGVRRAPSPRLLVVQRQLWIPHVRRLRPARPCRFLQPLAGSLG